jgi:hypothetical protein
MGGRLCVLSVRIIGSGSGEEEKKKGPIFKTSVALPSCSWMVVAHESNEEVLQRPGRAWLILSILVKNTAMPPSDSPAFSFLGSEIRPHCTSSRDYS